ncbi:MAG: hypothetical protein IPO02_00320 [Bacteroidetes bacterium]|nr:hypothetical protein [Bacteroidota bacterium]
MEARQTMNDLLIPCPEVMKHQLIDQDKTNACIWKTKPGIFGHYALKYKPVIGKSFGYLQSIIILPMEEWREGEKKKKKKKKKKRIILFNLIKKNQKKQHNSRKKKITKKKKIQITKNKKTHKIPKS